MFGSEGMDQMLRRLGRDEGEAMVHSWVNKAIEKSQAKVEARNFDVRKNILKYDDVMNQQRTAIFVQRREVMEADDVFDTIQDMRHSLVDDLVSTHIPERAYADQWDVEGLSNRVQELFGIELPIVAWGAEEGVDGEEINERLVKAVDEAAAKRMAKVGADRMRLVEKSVLLETLDGAWRDHLTTLDHLRSVIGLRGFAQRDPLNEFKSEAFELFDGLMGGLRVDVTQRLSTEDFTAEEPEMPEIPPEILAAMQGAEAPAERVGVSHDAPVDAEPPADVRGGEPLRVTEDVDANNPQTWGKVGRNEACPCGSGKKYKQCHGKL